MRTERQSTRIWDAPAAQPPFDVVQRGRAPSLADLVTQYARFNQMLTDRMNQMVFDALEPVMAKERKPRATHREEECGDPCAHDSCHCRCCIGDADLVVYARLGERRIVPIRIENARRREREISLELSDWTTRGGKKTAVTANLLTENKFTLAACSEQEVILAINASQLYEQKPGAADQPRLQDVDDCQVLYADLRVEGCEVRPVRIALALLPRDCNPYVIECGCSCC